MSQRLKNAITAHGALRYGPDVENYLEVYLRTPDLPRNHVVKALLARGNARKAGGESLLAKAEQGACDFFPDILLTQNTARLPHGAQTGPF
jgi:hypothetical protein